MAALSPQLMPYLKFQAIFSPARGSSSRGSSGKGRPASKPLISPFFAPSLV